MSESLYRLRVEPACSSEVRQIWTHTQCPSTDVFTLLCLAPTPERMRALDTLFPRDHSGLLRHVVKGWEGVVYETGTPVPFSASALDTLIEDEDVRRAAVDAYLDAWIQLIFASANTAKKPLHERLFGRLALTRIGANNAAARRTPGR